MKKSRFAAIFLCLLLCAPCEAAMAAQEPETPVLRQYTAELTALTSSKYYWDDDTQRYLDYKVLHPDASWISVITNVNIGLDHDFYTDTVSALNIGSTNVLVNKYHALPKTYVPKGLETINAKYSVGTQKLTRAARLAFEKMCADAKKLGYKIFATSAYRSYDKQAAVYDSFYTPDDPTAQDRLAARPGYSEHQTGLAVDVIRSNTALTSTSTYKWYVKNAYKYGFIIRYPDGKESVTGYSFEPWHLRYVGVKLATAVYKSGLTFDEYYAQEIALPVKSGVVKAVGLTATAQISVSGLVTQLSTIEVNGNTYFKLRDIAALLNKTSLQFDVTWDPTAQKIVLLKGSPYTGDPTITVADANKAALVTSSIPALALGDATSTASAINTGGTTYVTLPDLAALLGFTYIIDEGGVIYLSGV
ncbi:D-alanyl-D-alanine carboxypeptidase family protein [Oscillospiraceae bacterium WX1]